MSSGLNGDEKPNKDLALLAPRFRTAVEAAIATCRNAGLDAFVYEGYRTPALQAIYYARGRTVIPPTRTVTNAPTNLFSWHGYSLAVDVISQSRFWEPAEGDRWFAKVAEIFKAHDCKWGGDWRNVDLPHFQWAHCRPSPSDYARHLIQTRGIGAVWTVVGAA